jgi:DNA-binding NarL/FixJ family response regulator
MDIQSLLFFQILADFLLCFAIIFLLRQLNKKMVPLPPPSPAVSEETMREFRTLLEESQHAANSFLESMEESRSKLREVVQLLDKKEKSCRDIIEQSIASKDPRRNDAHEGKPSLPDNQFREILEMSRQGLSEQEISRRTGLSEGEVVLILDLERSKKEKA